MPQPHPVTEAIIESVADLYQVAQGSLPSERVRRIILPDALVDRRASLPSLPGRLIRELGLMETQRRLLATQVGAIDVTIYSAIRLTIQGRDCTTDVVEFPDDSPVVIGWLALDMLDLVIDPVSQCLTGNPRHGGKWISESYSTWGHRDESSL